MKDDNWEMITGQTAHRIEILNYLSQINQIEAMVIFSLHHYPSTDHGTSRHLNEVSLKELHRTGTFLLLAKPGHFRETGVELQLVDGTVIYNPPPPNEVEKYLKEFFGILSAKWTEFSPVTAGAFTLWFINWVHPFKNGNGRSARAFCYATMAMRMGYVPPGEQTVPELIKNNDDEYQTALRKADAKYKASGKPDLSALESLLDRLLAQQLEAALASNP
ncbi:Fic family protein [Sphingomonas sp. AR_OL41]|uniref:Fic family protein n=1 Tax=Sphingomonas sp. AR_OL41 TaxID=3042729 RepID=UPI002480AF6A|nr:Fic family protein [Sphingomonas sp. AR_OL41]MDH7973479.1 Fic family protein [Sphingomonas sp. AR_OL41]